MSNHPTVVMVRQYIKRHPEAGGQVIMFKKDGDDYIITGHREKTKEEKNFNWCCDPGNCSTHRE